jgi:predicted nuclease of predicted toxin-antitoxin system
MQIELDENLSGGLAPALRALGHDVRTVPEEGLQGRDDTTVWTAAQGEDRFLVTQDLAVADARNHPPGTHAGIALIRLRDPGRAALTERVLAAFTAEGASAWPGRLVVVTDRKRRVGRSAP